jgi:hypothetical protein
MVRMLVPIELGRRGTLEHHHHHLLVGFSLLTCLLATCFVLSAPTRTGFLLGNLHGSLLLRSIQPTLLVAAPILLFRGPSRLPGMQSAFMFAMHSSSPSHDQGSQASPSPLPGCHKHVFKTLGSDRQFKRSSISLKPHDTPAIMRCGAGPTNAGQVNIFR